jgi:tRNA pseudouridine55 synthase
VGWTSHDAVAVVRRQLGTRAVGHVGTLDPFATGLLVVLVGRATRLARFIESESKQYDAEFEFGRSTDTEDSTGQTLLEFRPDEWPEVDTIDNALAAMTGELLQTPPVFSAKQVQGKRSYALAREGKAIELSPVSVSVHQLERTGWQPPQLRVHAEVGKGTYLRSIARDLGDRLGIPAHCSALRRTKIGEFDVAEAVSPKDATALSLRPPEAMVPHLVRQQLDEEQVVELGFGRRVERTVDSNGVAALIAPEGRLIAVAEPSEDGRWQPVVVLEPSS